MQKSKANSQSYRKHHQNAYAKLAVALKTKLKFGNVIKITYYIHYFSFFNHY